MKIEVGKTYLTRDGRKAFVFFKDNKIESFKQSFQFVHELDDITDKKFVPSCFSNGINSGENRAIDLVAEYQAPRLKKCIEKVRYLSTRLGSGKCDVCSLFKELAEEILKEIGE